MAEPFNHFCYEENGYDFGIEPLTAFDDWHFYTYEPISNRSISLNTGSVNYYINSSRGFSPVTTNDLIGMEGNCAKPGGSAIISDVNYSGKFCIYSKKINKLYGINPFKVNSNAFMLANNVIRHFTQNLYAEQESTKLDNDGIPIKNEDGENIKEVIPELNVECMMGWLDKYTFLFYVLNCPDDYRIGWSIYINPVNDYCNFFNTVHSIEKEPGRERIHYIKTSITDSSSNFNQRNSVGELYTACIPFGISDHFASFKDLVSEYTQDYMFVQRLSKRMPYLTAEFPQNTPVALLLTTLPIENDIDYEIWLRGAAEKLKSFKLRRLFGTYADPTKVLLKENPSSNNKKDSGINVSEKFTPFTKGKDTILTTVSSTYSFDSQEYPVFHDGIGIYKPTYGDYDLVSKLYSHNNMRFSYSSQTYSMMYDYNFFSILPYRGTYFTSGPPAYSLSAMKHYFMYSLRTRLGFGSIDYTFGCPSPYIFVMAANNTELPAYLGVIFRSFSNQYMHQISRGPVHMLYTSYNGSFGAIFTIDASINNFSDLFYISTVSNFRFFTKKPLCSVLFGVCQSIQVTPTYTVEQAANDLLTWIYENIAPLEAIKNGTLFREERLKANPKEVFYRFPERIFDEVPSEL